jgi:hypothetical protein
MESSIEIKRCKQWRGAVNSFRIILDGEAVGYIRNNKSTSITVNPGHHSLKLNSASFPVGSQEIKFDINSGEKIKFECKSNTDVLLYVLFPAWVFDEGVDDWILLKQCD